MIVHTPPHLVPQRSTCGCATRSNTFHPPNQTRGSNRPRPSPTLADANDETPSLTRHAVRTPKRHSAASGRRPSASTCAAFTPTGSFGCPAWTATGRGGTTQTATAPGARGHRGSEGNGRRNDSHKARRVICTMCVACAYLTCSALGGAGAGRGRAADERVAENGVQGCGGAMAPRPPPQRRHCRAGGGRGAVQGCAKRVRRTQGARRVTLHSIV